MYRVGDRVVVLKFPKLTYGIVAYVKGYDEEKLWYIVEVEGDYLHLREEDIIKR